MKTLIISDIHANITALDAIWQQEHDADMIVSAGDIVDYGLHPCECIDWMIDKKVQGVFGNHDLAVIEAYDNPNLEEPLYWKLYHAQMLADRHISYLKNLPEKLTLDIDGEIYALRHAFCDQYSYDCIKNIDEFINFNQVNFSDAVNGCIFGHTHRSALEHLSDNARWINPGSVSYRRQSDDDRGAQYALIIDGEISLHMVPYAVEELHLAVLAAPVCESEKKPTYHWWAPR
ncbi:MAG: metallophosphoesterase family protein [Planctomycetes bacterium]|nr:metallophosphoesterase family protein [Planctomycetota bacterium]